MTVVTSIVAVVILATLLFTEVQNLANIFEALSTGFVKTNVAKNNKAGKVNMKEAYAAR